MHRNWTSTCIVQDYSNGYLLDPLHRLVKMKNKNKSISFFVLLKIPDRFESKRPAYNGKKIRKAGTKKYYRSFIYFNYLLCHWLKNDYYWTHRIVNKPKLCSTNSQSNVLQRTVHKKTYQKLLYIVIVQKVNIVWKQMK